MNTLKIYKRDGGILTIPNYSVVGGFPTVQGKWFVSKTACEADGADPRALTTKRPTDSTGKYYLKMGVNPDGNRLVDYDEDERERERKREQAETERKAALTPEQRAREERMAAAAREASEIERLEYLSEKALTRDTDDMNVDRGYRLQAQARSAWKLWAEKYPEARRARDAQALRSQAAHERDLAVGALVYDCDGSLSRDDQQRRHDSHIARAKALEAQASELEAS